MYQGIKAKTHSPDRSIRLTPVVKPPALIPGDRICIIAPSSSGSASYPHRVERGKSALEALGFEVDLYPSVFRNHLGSGGTPEERAADIHRAFSDPLVSAIIAATGGLTLNEVLPLLDFDLIRRNPRIFCGYSDNTLLHAAILSQAGFVSFYGPCLITQFGEFPSPLQYTIDSFMRVLCRPDDAYTVLPSGEWTDEILDWRAKTDLTRPREVHPNLDGHIWLREGSCCGQLVGGCLPSLLQMTGSPFSFDFKGRVLMIETPPGEDFSKGPSIAFVAAELAELRSAGIFDEISGLVVGRPFGMPKSDRKAFLEVIRSETEGFDFPVLANVNIGHADPIVTMPIGCAVLLDSSRNLFQISETAVSSNR